WNAEMQVSNLTFEGDIISPESTSLGGIAGQSIFDNANIEMNDFLVKGGLFHGRSNAGGFFGEFYIDDSGSLLELNFSNFQLELTELKTTNASGSSRAGGAFGILEIGQNIKLNATNIHTETSIVDTGRRAGGYSGGTRNY